VKSSLLCGILAFIVVGCAGAPPEELALPLRNVGLIGSVSATADAVSQASGVPPLGEGVAPISGSAGDGATVVTQVGGWSGGPGAVRWHGGQWVMPYSPRSGATLQNVSCDIWNPTTSAPANVLVEVVSSNGQVLGSATAPASTTAVIRAWPFVGAHPVIDGEQIVVRLSATDAMTHQWTTGAQDTTVIGCAVNEARTHTIVVPVPAAVARTGGGVPAASLQSGSASWLVASTGELVYPLPVYAGDVITGFRVFGNKQSSSSTRLAATLMTASSSGGSVTGSATASNQIAAPGSFVLTVTGLSTVAAAGNSYVIQADSTTGSSLDIWTDAEVTIAR